MAAVVFEGITKRFGDFVAVDDLTLHVHDGEFMVLLGPSGCGKTTALRMVAGLDQPTTGTLRIGDEVVNHTEAKERNISMVFQSYALYPHMSVRRNIESPLVARPFDAGDGTVLRKLDKAQRTARVEEVAATLGLTELLGRKPAALSGGQRQRVALARAIVSRPAAFLMDEPLSNLDAKLRAQTRIELVDLHRRLGTTCLYVTHDQVEAMTMASRIALMSEGRLQQVGPPQEVYRRPTNLFVARFLGSPPMNTIDGVLATDSGTLRLDVTGGTIPIDANCLDGAEPTRGRALIAGIRPEHISLGPDPATGGGEPTLTASAHAVEWLGHERLVTCMLGSTQLQVRDRGETAVTPGEPVRLAVHPGEVHLFDPETTERIR